MNNPRITGVESPYFILAESLLITGLKQKHHLPVFREYISEINMTKTKLFLTSPAVWTLVGLFVYHGLTAIAPSFGGTFGMIVQSVLAVLALYLHPSELKVAGVTGKTTFGSTI